MIFKIGQKEAHTLDELYLLIFDTTLTKIEQEIALNEFVRQIQKKEKGYSKRIGGRK